jgi:hypothetical protein
MRTEWPNSPARPVSFTIFEWSGENSHQARLTAASELATHLRAIADAHNGAAHFVVAHSHGGNVALAALSEDSARRSVDAIACLNTPFIQCRARSVLPAIIALIVCNPFVWLMLAAPVVLDRYLIPRYPGQFMKAVVIGAALTMAAAIPAAFAGVRAWRWSEGIIEALERYQRRRAETFRTPDLGSVRVFAATVKRDEAYRYLSILDRLTGISASGMLVSRALFFAGVASYFIAGSGGFLTDFDWFPALTRGALMLSRLALYLVSAGFIVFLLSVVVMTIAGISLRGHRFAYGEALGDSLLLNIRVTAYPPGGSAVDVRVFEAEGEGMQHSALHGSPALVHALAAWFQTVPASTSAQLSTAASALPQCAVDGRQI